MDAVRGKVAALSRQSLGILRRSGSYGGQGILKIPADLVPPTPAPSEAKGQLLRSGTFAAGGRGTVLWYAVCGGGSAHVVQFVTLCRLFWRQRD